MKFTESDPGDGPPITAYSPDGIVIGGQRHRGGLVVTPRRVLTGWGPAAPEELTAAHLAALLEQEPEPALLLLGTGRRQVFPPPAALAGVRARGLGIEIMDTGAACRTYNILLSEGRRMVAGLLPLTM